MSLGRQGDWNHHLCHSVNGHWLAKPPHGNPGALIDGQTEKKVLADRHSAKGTLAVLQIRKNLFAEQEILQPFSGMKCAVRR